LGVPLGDGGDAMAGKPGGASTSPTFMALMIFSLLFGVVLLQAEVGSFARAVRPSRTVPAVKYVRSTMAFLFSHVHD
jgi:hypothetical protein